MVTVECHNPAGVPTIWRIRCVEPGEVLAESKGMDGESWIGLVPGQGVRIDLNESYGRVEPLGER